MLMILSAILAITIGVFFQRTRTQKHAVAQIENLGGAVTYQDTWLGSSLPESIRQSVGDDYVANAVSVRLKYRTLNRRMTTPSQDELKLFVDAVQRLPLVKTLATHSLNLKDEDLAIFAPLKNQIEELNINELYHSDFHGARLDLLSNWKQLRVLSIHSRLYTNDNLEGNPQPTDQLDIAPLANLPHLEQITLGSGEFFDERVFEDLSTLTHLKTISFWSCRFDGSHLRFLGKLPHLERIWLNNTHAEVDAGQLIIRKDGSVHQLEEPTFRFEPSYDGWMGQPKEFPRKEYQRWIKETLGEVQVFEMFSS